MLDRDPLRVGLANNGQARITPGHDERVMRELRAELETFVCKGQFADALERLLERYLANLDASRQDAVWVSGFFGSGKSHLLKMLAHLWVNTEFGDGQTARGLVADRLPAEVRHALRELDTRARRIGLDPVAAAGSLLGATSGMCASRYSRSCCGRAVSPNSTPRHASASGFGTRGCWTACGAVSKPRAGPGSTN